MNRQRTENSSSTSYCEIHPNEILVGVCPLCLNERLMVLASQQRRIKLLSSLSSSSSSSRSRANNNLQKLPESSSDHHQNNNKKKLPIALPHRFFAFFGLFELRRYHRSHRSSSYKLHHHDASIFSPDDSFISIKFNDNGVTSWDRGKVSKVPLEHCKVLSWDHDINKDTKQGMIQHSKPRDRLTWRKRIGQLFHVMSLKGSLACHVSANVEDVKVSRSWIRPLTKKKVPN